MPVLRAYGLVERRRHAAIVEFAAQYCAVALPCLRHAYSHRNQSVTAHEFNLKGTTTTTTTYYKVQKRRNGLITVPAGNNPYRDRAQQMGPDLRSVVSGRRSGPTELLPRKTHVPSLHAYYQ